MNIDWSQFAYLTPELVIGLGAVMILGLDAFLPRRSARELGWASAVVLIVGLMALKQVWPAAAYSQRLFCGALARDYYSLVFDAIFLVAGLLGVLLSLGYVEKQEVPPGEYYALTLFAVLGMMLMAASADLITLFISYEILSLSVYVLAGIVRAHPRSAEASLKYFLLGAFSSGFLIYGIALVYGATGTTSLDNLHRFVAPAAYASNPLLLMGLALITIGFAFKVAIVPFHAWVPDVYEGAPVPVTAFMAAGVKAAAFAAIGRVFLVGFSGLSATWQPIMWVLATLTMILGNTAALPQTNIKRMLAYSSIAHAGYLLVAISASAAGELAVASVIFYSLVYTAMTIGAFAVSAAVSREEEARQDLTDYQGLATRHPWLAGAMGLFMISLAGIPPTAGFLGKFTILNAVVRAGVPGLAVVMVLASVISWYYYLRVVWYMYFDASKEKADVASKSPSLALAVGVAAVLVIGLGVLPALALNLSHVGARSLLGLLAVVRVP